MATAATPWWAWTWPVLAWVILLIMPFSLLSGLTTPLSNMPLALQYFTALNPLRYAIDITQRVYLEGAGLGSRTSLPERDVNELRLRFRDLLAGAAREFARRA